MRQFHYVVNLAKFAFKANPALYLSVVISLFSVAIELLAMSSLLPLFTIVSGGQPSAGDIVSRGLRTLGVPVTANVLLWAFLVLFSLRVLTQLVGQSLSMYLGRRVLAQLGSAAFSRITRTLSLSEISEKSMGFYISLAGEEAFRASVVVISLTQLVSVVALTVLYFGAIAFYSPSTAGVLTVFLGISSLVLFRVITSLHRMGARQVAHSRRANSVFLDTMNNLKAVRAFSAEAYVSSLYGSLVFAYTKIWFWIDELSLLSKLIPVLLLLLVTGLWLGFSTASIASVGLPFVVTMIVFLMRFFPALGQVVALAMKIASDAKSGKDVTDMLGTKTEVRVNAGQPVATIDDIEFRGVTFHYPSEPDRTILRDTSIRFARGNTYAIVGKSGIGKSTLVDLILKFYAPTSGEVLVNGVPISALSDEAIRKRIVLVSQDAAIFNDTVMNNICLGLDATPGEVESACRLACIHDYIASMPEGYQTGLQYQGDNLSGGQRQRIAIARGLLRKPDVLILDESTNALDKKTQDAVMQNLFSVFADKMLVFVTHDPDIAARVDVAINFADMITPAQDQAPRLPDAV